MTFGINIGTKFISRQLYQCYVTQTLANDSRVIKKNRIIHTYIQNTLKQLGTLIKSSE